MKQPNPCHLYFKQVQPKLLLHEINTICFRHTLFCPSTCGGPDTEPPEPHSSTNSTTMDPHKYHHGLCCTATGTVACSIMLQHLSLQNHYSMPEHAGPPQNYTNSIQLYNKNYTSQLYKSTVQLPILRWQYTASHSESPGTCAQTVPMYARQTGRATAWPASEQVNIIYTILGALRKHPDIFRV
jgi:hypothetical protein